MSLEEQELIEKAIVYATAKHAGQYDFNGQPFILHPLRVMLTVHKEGGTAEETAAAGLHDVVEDTSATIEDITERFGAKVARYVDILTRVPGDGTYKQYIDKVSGDESSTKIKKADLRDNMDPDRVTKEKQGLYKRHAEAYHRLKYGGWGRSK
jgi:(p)ppGpp synthase/HD superfamily hydrolase